MMNGFDDNSYDPRKLMELQQMLEEAKGRGPASLEIPQEAPPTPEIDPALQAARDERDKMQMYGNLLRGFQDIVKAGTGFQPSYAVADSLKEQGKQKVTDYKEDQASKVASENRQMEKDKQEKLMEKLSMDIDKSKLDFQNAEALSDPSSPQSKFVQDAYLQMQQVMGSPANEEQVRSASGTEIYKISPWMQDMYSAKLKAELDKAKLGQQEKRIAQADERLDVQREKETGKQKRFERSQTFKEEEKQEISDKQTEDITQYDMGNDVLDRIEDQFAASEEFLGPYASRIEDKASLVPGVEKDPEFVKMQALVGDQLAKYVKTLSGTAVSDEERARLEKNIPMMTDKPGEFKAKIKIFRDTLNEAKKRTISNIEKQGKNPSAFKDGQKPGGMKKRVVQDGNIFEIDETGNAKFVGKAQ